MEATGASVRETMPENLELLAKGRLHNPDPGRLTGMLLWAGRTLVQVVAYRTPHAKKD